MMRCCVSGGACRHARAHARADAHESGRLAVVLSTRMEYEVARKEEPVCLKLDASDAISSQCEHAHDRKNRWPSRAM